MKDTRKLSVIYFINFMITLLLLLLVCFGCENTMEVEYIHSVNGHDVFYTDTINPDDVESIANELIKYYSENFVITSDYGIIEVEDGEIVYSNIKK